MPEHNLPPSPFPTQADTPTLAHLDPGFASPPALVGRTLGGYELLEEIGRGGMGVVFRARHRTLNRVVALKMILTGQLASADDVRRFRTEAEAAALLDHPNIVPVFEVGDEAGQHFFACKLIDGGGLSQHVPRLLEDAKETARLLTKIARAVDHAHQRGVLHRDLKPANILVDAQGEPHVADFGLARRTGDAGQTQSGAIVGTPGYMAPEQARAEKTLTTAADVYSLGAVLYECLTGKPPFHADTALETVLQVLEKEPVPPSALNPRVDPELEAVCLKCLAKEPSGRYPSAAALADDLEAWLAGGTVTARPPSTLGRLRLWLRKDFRTALLTLILGFVFGLLFSSVQWTRMATDAAIASNFYAASFPSETPPGMAAWLGGLVATSATPASAPSYSPDPLTRFALMLAGVFGGLVLAWILRPKSLGSALSVGLTTGMVSILVALLLGGWWMSIRTNALRWTQAHLALLADGFRAESLQRQAAQARQASTALEDWQKKLEKDLPDLLHPEVAEQERGRVLTDKIDVDLRLHLLPAFWSYFGYALGICLIPLAGQTAIAQTLVARGDRRPRLFVHYLELVVPGTLLAQVIVQFLAFSILGFGAPAAFRILALLVWAVGGATMWDQFLRWQRPWRIVVLGGWAIAGLGLAASYLHLVLARGSGWLPMDLKVRGSFLVVALISIMHSAILAVAVYGIFLKRWRWYVRLATYLGIVAMTAVVVYFVMR